MTVRMAGGQPCIIDKRYMAHYALDVCSDPLLLTSTDTCCTVIGISIDKWIGLGILGMRANERVINEAKRMYSLDPGFHVQ